MLLWLYVVFLAISLILIIFGFASGISMFNLIGTLMLLLLGFVLVSEGVSYKVGENISTVVQPDNSTLQVVNDVYDSWSDTSEKPFGYLLILLGVLGFIFSIYDI